MPLISVVIPCYNAGEYIKNSLEALEKQTFKDFDVILVDDCSVDNTAEVIAEYKAHSKLDILYLKNECNSGPAASRNKAIASSKAEYVCFCDSDDWYDEDYLEKMMTVVRNNNADVAACGYRVVLKNGNTFERTLSDAKCVLSQEESLLLNVDSLCCLLVKTQIAKKFPLPNLRNGEDMAIIPVWFMQANGCAIIPRAMYNYLLRSESVSNKVSIKTVDSLVSSFDFIYANMIDLYSKQIEYIGVRNLIYGALLNLFKCGNYVVRAQQLVSSFEKKFPEWRNNQYIHRLPLFKRIFVKSVSKGKFYITRLLAKIHKLLSK